jgi:hypothetical protein
MRAPNGQSLPISPHKDYAIAVGGDVLWRCVPHFREAVAKKASVTFELNEHDIFMLRQHYHEEGDSTAEHLCLFLNEVFEARNLPFTAWMAMVSTKTLICQCTIKARAL